jgi:putative flavoprotein involved in K+ transport
VRSSRWDRRRERRTLGVVVTGRVEGFRGSRVLLGGNLERDVAAAERRLHVLLARVDELVAATAAGPEPVASVRVAEPPRSLDLAEARISTIVWATGYRREYPWLHVPVLDADGELVQRRGVTAVPGVYVLGQRFQYRRGSHFIGGVGADAEFLARHIVGRHAGPARRGAARAGRGAWQPAPAR